MSDFEHITTDAAVATYNATTDVFNALLHEIRELSKKKPDATMSASKVKLVNKVLDDLLTVLENEPEGKYLQRLESDDLPQVSDALLMMAQFNAALAAFKKRYLQLVRVGYSSEYHWITAEKLEGWEADDAEVETGDDI
ncbi:hypothetical protein [Asaia astilbis]|uniref:hypothetical protein n=1 Tax=Asaia astilbis TaxID=610244 RepID=UPI000ACCB53F|nr:hypothetical protein [Asaia astilbis]